MAATPDDAVLIRHIQGLGLLLSCLPAGGKASEYFKLALDSPESEWRDKVKAPDEPDTEEGMRAYLESVFPQDGNSNEVQKLADWQSDSDNMTGALSEFRDVANSLSAG